MAEEEPKEKPEKTKVTEEVVVEPEFTWEAKTELGKKVLSGEITDINYILDNAKPVLEVQIIEKLLPGLETDLLLIGQAKGKFGGGKRRVFKQTQKKTNEGNKPHFSTLAVVGNKNGIIGIGHGKSKETVPAREKAFRNAKVSLFKIKRGCGSWECGCGTSHSLPFVVEGKCGSVKIKLIPAPKGTGLIVESECAKILEMAGITDVWSKTIGHTKTKINLLYACIDALRKLTTTKVQPKHEKLLSIAEGIIENGKEEEHEETDSN